MYLKVPLWISRAKLSYFRFNSFNSLFFSVLVCISGIKGGSDYYRAAVLEHVRFGDISYPPTEIIQKNLEIYDIAAKIAAADGADIIVFSEWGLFPHLKENRSFLLNFGEYVPDPKRIVSNPCNETILFEDRPVLTKLSCMARDNGLFVVANIVDQKDCQVRDTCDANSIEYCSKNCHICPEDGKYFFNTNVVFNREGTLVARYYKRHLYFEFDMNEPPFPEDIFFATDFGNFTTVTCFDLMFQESVAAVENSGVVNVAYPSYWYDHVPFLFFATPYQQAWAMANRVNLLAANAHYLGTGTMGSGIYSADKGALIYTHNPDGRHKVLISNVRNSFSESGTDSVPLNAKRFVIENGEAVEVDEEEERHFEDQCVTNILGETNGTGSSYRCHPSSIDHYDFVKLERNGGTVEMCSNDFCCSISYQADSMEEDYYFAVTGKNLNFYQTYSYGVQGCFLSRCESFDGNPCMNYILKSNTVFRTVELKGNFTTRHVFPFAVDSHIRLTDRNSWSYDRKSTIEYSNPTGNSSLLFLGLYGRNFDLDALINK